MVGSGLLSGMDIGWRLWLGIIRVWSGSVVGDRLGLGPGLWVGGLIRGCVGACGLGKVKDWSDLRVGISKASGYCYVY